MKKKVVKTHSKKSLKLTEKLLKLTQKLLKQTDVISVTEIPFYCKVTVLAGVHRWRKHLRTLEEHIASKQKE